jgi:hypothetical protein
MSRANHEEESMTESDYYRRLTEEEERELMDPSFWEGATSEVFPGNPDARLGFHVSLDRRHARMLADAARRTGTNAVDLVQRYVEERLEADAAAVDDERRAKSA